jgi:hypothetical protein
MQSVFKLNINYHTVPTDILNLSTNSICSEKFDQIFLFWIRQPGTADLCETYKTREWSKMDITYFYKEREKITILIVLVLYNKLIIVLQFAGFINRNLLDVLAPIQHSDESESPGKERFRD